MIVFSADNILANVFDAKLNNNETNFDVYNVAVSMWDVKLYVSILAEILNRHGQEYKYFDISGFGKFYGDYYNKNIYYLMGSIFFIKYGMQQKHEEYLQEINKEMIEQLNEECNADYDILERYKQAKEIFSSVLNTNSDDLAAIKKQKLYVS